MKNATMREVNDFNELKDNEFLFIKFKDNKEHPHKWEYINNSDYSISTFEDMIYIYDENLEIKGRFPVEYVEKLIAVGREDE